MMVIAAAKAAEEMAVVDAVGRGRGRGGGRGGNGGVNGAARKQTPGPPTSHGNDAATSGNTKKLRCTH